MVDEDPEVVKEVPAEVIGKTIPKQKALANTGGIPLLLGAGFLLACAAAISVRVLRSLAPAPLPHDRVHKG